MPKIRKYVNDENIRNFKDKLRKETDPAEIKRLEAMIEREENLYAAALRLPEGNDG